MKKEGLPLGSPSFFTVCSLEQVAAVLQVLHVVEEVAMVPEVALVIALTAWKDAIFWSRSSQTVQTWGSAATVMMVSLLQFVSAYICRLRRRRGQARKIFSA